MIDAHGNDDHEGADRLWFESTPEDALSEGEVLSIGPDLPDHSVGSACANSAHRFGGCATTWAFAGTAEDVVSAITGVLSKAER